VFLPVLRGHSYSSDGDCLRCGTNAGSQQSSIQATIVHRSFGSAPRASARWPGRSVLGRHSTLPLLRACSALRSTQLFHKPLPSVGRPLVQRSISNSKTSVAAWQFRPSGEGQSTPPGEDTQAKRQRSREFPFRTGKRELAERGGADAPLSHQDALCQFVTARPYGLERLSMRADFAAKLAVRESSLRTSGLRRNIFRQNSGISSVGNSSTSTAYQM